MTLDPTLRDQLAKTIHDTACPCSPSFSVGGRHIDSYLTAADQAAELLTAHDDTGMHEPSYTQGYTTGRRDAEQAARALTPQPAPIVLPTVEEVALVIWEASHLDEGTISAPVAEIVAQAALDLIASRVRHWVPINVDDIKVGHRVRWVCENSDTEGAFTVRQIENDCLYFENGYVWRQMPYAWYIDPATVPAEPTLEERKVAMVLECLDQTDPETREADARRLIERLDALEADR